MTFDSRERSLATAQPVRLYGFSRGTQRWGYCSADRAITLQGQTWLPQPISDDGIRLTGQTSAEVLTITGPARLEVAQLFRAAPPSAEIGVMVRDYHFGEADAAPSSRLAWLGTISSVRWPQPDRSELICEPLVASLERPGLRLTWERTCPYTIYDRNCRVDRNAFAVPFEVQTLDGASVSDGSLAAFDDGYFSGGYVEWALGGGELETRAVELHTGSTLLLLGGTPGLQAGQAMTAYPGCRQTNQYCNDVFDNLNNSGAVAHLPGKSPFDGSPVF